MTQSTKAKQEIFSQDPEAAKESRCFFCYGTFEEEEVITRIDKMIYHNDCLNDLLIANEIESLLLIKLDDSQVTIQGYQLKYPYPKGS